MGKINNHIKSLVFIFISTIYATTAVGQDSINYACPSKPVIKHWQTTDEIWDFAKPYKKKHAVLTIFGINVNDTLSIKIGNKILLDCRVYNMDDKIQLAGISGVMDEAFYVIYYSKNRIKSIYNSRNWSEYCIFGKGISENDSYEVEIILNGVKSMFFLQPTARWHFVFIERESKKAFYTARDYFTGLD